MNLMDVFSVLLYFVITTSLGFVFLQLIRLPKSIRCWASHFLTGQIIWLILFLLGNMFSLPVDYFIWSLCLIAPLAALIAYNHTYRSENSEAISPKPYVWRKFLSWGFILICIISFPQVFVMVFRIPLVEWDARSIWFFHAKALWIHNGIQSEYFTNQNYAFWSHLDYPLLLPVQAAVIGFLRGEWSEMAVKGYLLFNFFAYIWLLQLILVRRGWYAVTACFVAIPIMGISLPAYLNGYADNHYAMPLMLGMLLLFQKECYTGDWCLAGLMVAFALNTKNEVTLYLLMGSAVWLLYLKLKNRLTLGNLKPDTCGWGIITLGLLPFVLWFGFKAIHGIEGDLHLSSRLLNPYSSIMLCLQRAPDILRAMRIVHMQIYSHALLGIVVLVTAWRGYLRRGNKINGPLISLEERFVWVLFLIVNIMIFTVYGLTPYDVNWHLGTSINRLILFPGLIVIVLLINAVERIVCED